MGIWRPAKSRYNLVAGKVCGPRAGEFLGGVAPWLLGWLLYTGHGCMELLSWTGLVLNGFIDFVGPALVALVAVTVVGVEVVRGGASLVLS